MHRIFIVVAVAGTVLGVSAAPALAHGETEQQGVTFVVGFAVEPAYINQPNAVQLIISHHGQPVTDVKPSDLDVAVEFGGQRTSVPLEAAFEVGEFGTPGDYRGDFIPTQPGRYTFDVTGTVDGHDVDFSMTSGPKAFSEVQDTASAQFPPENAPSTSDLAARIDAETARADGAIASVNDAADSARTMAIVAGIIALIAVIVAVVAVARPRRSTGA